MNYADGNKWPARDIAVKEVLVSEATGKLVVFGVEIPLKTKFCPKGYVSAIRAGLERVIEEIRKQR